MRVLVCLLLVGVRLRIEEDEMQTSSSNIARPQENIDGGYGWVIVFSSFLMHFVLLGLTRSFGIIYIALLRRFDNSAAEVASTSAVFNAVRMILGSLSLDKIFTVKNSYVFDIFRSHGQFHLQENIMQNNDSDWWIPVVPWSCCKLVFTQSRRFLRHIWSNCRFWLGARLHTILHCSYGIFRRTERASHVSEYCWRRVGCCALQSTHSISTRLLRLHGLHAGCGCTGSSLLCVRNSSATVAQPHSRRRASALRRSNTASHNTGKNRGSLDIIRFIAEPIQGHDNGVVQLHDADASHGFRDDRLLSSGCSRPHRNFK